MTTNKPHPTPTAAACQAQRCVMALTRLAPEVQAAAVADIFKRTRERHRDMAISGAMLFDGERFGVLLCGEPAAVQAALDALTTDSRQALPLLLSDGEGVPSWAPRGWRSGWSEPDSLAALAAADAPRGDAAVQAWRALVGASDLL